MAKEYNRLVKMLNACHFCWSVQRKICMILIERGAGHWIYLSRACFLIARPFLNIYRHPIHQMEAEYQSYLMISVML